MAIFFIDLNKLREYNENILQMEQNGTERSRNDYINKTERKSKSA